MWKIETIKYSIKGPRLKNEDSIEIIEDVEGVYGVVADGIGSFENSELISHSATNLFVNSIKKNIDIDLSLLVVSIDYEIKKNNVISKAGTTLSGFVFSGDVLRIIHVGDSRIYFSSENLPFEQITIDHVIARGGNRKSTVLTNYIGNIDKSNILSVKKRIENSFTLLICSDGFYEAINDISLNLIFSKYDSIKNIDNQLKIELANRNLKDNCSYGIIKCTRQ
jgi:serine/threonine protein phosphatase PrpC